MRETPNNTANFAGLCLERGRTSEAKELAKRAWELNAGQPTQVGAEVALYLGVIAQMEGHDDTPALGRLKTSLTQGFERSLWPLDDILAAAGAKLSHEKKALYVALAAAILDSDKVPDLANMPRLKEIAPIPLDVAWKEEATN